MSKSVSANYYQENKERLPKKCSSKISKSFYRRKRKKEAIWSGKVSQKMKNKSLFSIEKYYKMRKNALL